jgi:anti-anti-sigma factor
MKDASVGQLHVTREQRDGVVVIHAEGEVDLDNAEKLSSAVRSVDAHRGSSVVLDLIGVPFMDSSGLKVLLLASQELGDRLVLALSPGSPVMRLFELAEVADRFSVDRTVDEAIRSLSSR